MKVGDMVENKHDLTVPAGAMGLVVEKDNRQPTAPRWTVRWFIGNVRHDGHIVSETTGYGYGMEVVCDS